MNPLPIIAAAAAIGQASRSAGVSENATVYPVRNYNWNPFHDEAPHRRFAATGIPTPPRRNQRQRRKLHRQTRPHRWKGGAQ